MAIFQTANSHQTSSLIAEQLPDFIRTDHPVFVTFLEKYYEFLANNTLMETPDGDYTYYGADTALKIIPDINDIDTTDLDKFIESFRKQYGPTLPQRLSENTNTRTLYKNLIDFYRSVGTEDSFKLLFRVLFNDEIEIYYPKQDMLIASGGEWKQQVRIKVQHVDNLNDIKNKKIIGATSGAYGTVEEVIIYSQETDQYISGQIANTSLDYHGTFGGANSAGISNNEIYDSQRFVEDLTQAAFIYMTEQSGEFELFEELYVDDPTVSVANTIILPLPKRMLLYKNFLQKGANSVISITDQLHRGHADSMFPPWGSANISYANTGIWHTTGLGQGEIKLVSDVAGSSLGQVLQIGNNSSTGVANVYGDLRHFVYSRSIGVGGEDRLYRMKIRVRDLGGNSASSVAEGNRFSAGVACLRHDQRRLSSDGYSDQWEDPIWLVSHKQAIDDEFFTYIAYFRGRELKRSITANTPYLSTNYGSGGRTDLTSGTRYYNSAQRAMDGEVRLPFNTTWFRPTFKVNEPGDGATYSQGITQIDFVSIEEMSAIQKQIGKNLGTYQSERSLLSTKGAYLHDGYYRQIYAYDIRSKQQMKDYATIVRETVHPAGLKMFGTMINERATVNASVKSSNTNLLDPFFPNQLDSLAGWWRADALGPQNLQERKYAPEITSNGIYGTNINRFPIGMSRFEQTGLTIGSGGSGDSIFYSLSSQAEIEFVANASPIGGRQVLKQTDTHVQIFPQLLFVPDGGDINYGNYDTSEYAFPVVIEPNKKWLFSAYAMTSNLIHDNSSQNNAFYVTMWTANSSGRDFTMPELGGGLHRAAGAWDDMHLTQKDTWERLSTVIDMTSNVHLQNSTKVALVTLMPDRSSFVQATGNTTLHLDGLMLEEYIPEIHGTSYPYTPSSYVIPGMSGANVISWADQSPNKHHVYANTHGGTYSSPQFVANAVGGKPAVRFSANTVKNTSNVYQYTSIGGTANSIALELGDATNFKPPTSGLQTRSYGTEFADGAGTLASNSLPRPVSNTWTIMAVVKTNLGVNATSYDSTLNPTIFNSGYGGNRDSNVLIPNRARGTMSLGYDVIGSNGAVVTNLVNSRGEMTQANTSEITDFGGSHSSPSTQSSFRIVGVSVNAASGVGYGDLINFHIDGRRFANSEVNNSRADLSFAGFDGHTQNTHTTSIGKWKPVKGVVLPFPVYPEANGIMGVGATGNVQFYLNTTTYQYDYVANGNPDILKYSAGNLYCFNKGGIDFVASNGSIIPTRTGGDFGIPTSAKFVATPYKAGGTTPIKGTGSDAYLMYSNMNAVARFGTTATSINDSFGAHRNIIPVEWDAANSTWYAIYAGQYSPAPHTGYGAPFVPDVANGDFLVGRIHKSNTVDVSPGGGSDSGIDEFESWVFANSAAFAFIHGNQAATPHPLQEIRSLHTNTFFSDTYKNLITGTADWDGDIAEIVVFNEKLSNTNISKVEGYLAHKYSLQENLIHKDGITNDTEIYRWEFANTQDGWQFPSAGTISYEWPPGEANNYIIVPGDGSSGTLSIKINLPTHIDGSAYDHFSIRYYVDANGTDTANVFQFGWKNDESSTEIHTLPAAGGAGGYTALDTWYQNTYNLSGQTNWVGKKITYLEYSFITSDGNDDYKIDWATVSGNNHPHPYRHNAPVAIGANGWNVSY